MDGWRTARHEPRDGAAVAPQAEEAARLLPWAREAEDAALREPAQHSEVLLLHAQARGVQAGHQRAR